MLHVERWTVSTSISVSHLFGWLLLTVGFTYVLLA